MTMATKAFGFLASLLALLISPLSFSETSSEVLHWRLSTPLPEPRAGYAAGVIGGKLVIAGGTHWEGQQEDSMQKVFSGSTHVFDPATEQWQKLPDAPIPFGYAASTVVNNSLYVFGGYTGKEVSHRILRLEKRGNVYVWSVFGEMPRPRLFAGAMAIGSSVYLVGGMERFEPTSASGACCTSESATNTLMVLDTRRPQNGWQQLPGFPGSKRWLFAYEADGTSLWMLGGNHQPNLGREPQKFREALRYRIATAMWEQVSPLPEAAPTKSPVTALWFKDRMILFSFQKTVWELNPKTLQYREIQPLPEDVFVDRFFRIGNRIIGTGGENKVKSPRRRSEWTFIGEFVAHQ